MSGPLLGLDVGERRIGIALSDSNRIIASPHSVLTRTGIRIDVEAMVTLVDTVEATGVVAGWPLQSNGQPGAQALLVKRFLDPLSLALGYPVELWDERMSSVAAERSLMEGGMRGKKKKALVDKVAAALILQGWLDAR